MSDYMPDKWCLLEVQSSKGPYVKVFGSWAGGWAGSDSWKLSSGTTTVKTSERGYELPQESGSVYFVREGGYGATGYGHGVLSNFLEKAPDRLRVLTEEEAMAWLVEINRRDQT